MDLIAPRIFAPLTAALFITATQPAFAECAVAEYDVELGQSISVPLSPRISAQIGRKDERIRLDIREGETVTYRTVIEADWVVEPDWGIHQVIATDVNNDGVKELLIGVGRGMVSSYYTMLIFHADGTLHNTVDVSDPEFCKTDRGFLSWYRSGPRGTDTYWAINAAGLPYRQITQTIVDDVISHRVFHAEDGTVTAQSIVPNETRILTVLPPFTAAAAANPKGVTIFATTNRQHKIAQLQAGAALVLLGADDTYSQLLVEYSQGKRGWIMLEDVAYD